MAMPAGTETSMGAYVRARAGGSKRGRTSRAGGGCAGQSRSLLAWLVRQAATRGTERQRAQPE